jgi:hypothetical protein
MVVELKQKIVDPRDLRLNKLQVEDRAFHDWYRFVLSFPPHLVREYLQKFDLDENAIVLDPFCGTGTTLVEAKKMRHKSLGVEAHPMAHFASKVKADWNVDIDALISHAHLVYEACCSMNNGKNILLHFNDGQNSILLRNSISPIPLHKCLLLYNEIIKCTKQKLRDIELLALADVCVRSASNLKFGPEVGVSRKEKEDAPVFGDWINKIITMAEDLYNGEYFNISSDCYLNDSRTISRFLPENSVDAVITSPPYPNEKDYTRTTRLETVLLKFVNNKNELRALKQNLLRHF